MSKSRGKRRAEKVAKRRKKRQASRKSRPSDPARKAGDEAIDDLLTNARRGFASDEELRVREFIQEMLDEGMTGQEVTDATYDMAGPIVQEHAKKQWSGRGKPSDEFVEKAAERIHDDLANMLDDEIAKHALNQHFPNLPEAIRGEALAILKEHWMSDKPEDEPSAMRAFQQVYEHIQGYYRKEAKRLNREIRAKEKARKLTNRELEALTKRFGEMLSVVDEAELAEFRQSVRERFEGEDLAALEALIDARQQEFDFVNQDITVTLSQLTGRGTKQVSTTQVDLKEMMDEEMADFSNTERQQLNDWLHDRMATMREAGTKDPIDLSAGLDHVLSHRTETYSGKALLVGGKELGQQKVGGSTVIDTGPKRNKPEEYSVDAYMDALAQAYDLTKMTDMGMVGMQKEKATPEQIRESRHIWATLREARVFHVGFDTYSEVYQEADRYTTQEIAGQDYHSYDPNRKLPEEETRHWRATLLRASRHAFYPEKFPFPNVFLGYGQGAEISLPTLQMMGPAAIRPLLVKGLVRGHIMTAEGDCWAFIRGITRGLDGMLHDCYWFEPLRWASIGWPRTLDLSPYILPTFINIINDHRTFIVEANMRTGQRRDYKKNRKHMGVKGRTPPPYYTLRLKNQVLRETMRTTFPKPRGPRNYKTDVRAHERCRIRRGPLPLDPELAIKLKKREYKIFTTNKLDADTYERLHKRNMAYKRADEWLAIKVSWVEEHLNCNNPEVPYIPAVRTFPSDVRPTKPSKPTGSWADDPGA